mmetsp:Transcript_24537/g.71809  ORF Transcript_24537/g.71809 Transcript_24537/m.71809 type:complete len:325 (-) Transcript_24537:347-1321(-)
MLPIHGREGHPHGHLCLPLERLIEAPLAASFVVVLLIAIFLVVACLPLCMCERVATRHHAGVSRWLPVVELPGAADDTSRSVRGCNQRQPCCCRSSYPPVILPLEIGSRRRVVVAAVVAGSAWVQTHTHGRDLGVVEVAHLSPVPLGVSPGKLGVPPKFGDIPGVGRRVDVLPPPPDELPKSLECDLAVGSLLVVLRGLFVLLLLVLACLFARRFIILAVIAAAVVELPLLVLCCCLCCLLVKRRGTRWDCPPIVRGLVFGGAHVKYDSPLLAEEVIVGCHGTLWLAGANIPRLLLRHSITTATIITRGDCWSRGERGRRCCWY